ncbi:hypothetical protein F383_15995 [Gossypium arboreum]|uniref:Uncharacterized protein n=1 Tax=Gossypium arboreum TaxID=29729 RepID=A0A0B0PYC5_GOSAR|nr:hypothetical protein F383_15995 [Gossypium arboreum]
MLPVNRKAISHKYHRKADSLVQNGYRPFTSSGHNNPTPCNISCHKYYVHTKSYSVQSYI